MSGLPVYSYRLLAITTNCLHLEGDRTVVVQSLQGFFLVNSPFVYTEARDLLFFIGLK